MRKKKLFQFQKKIQSFKNQPRCCRQFQRLLTRTRCIQFLIIRQILFSEMHKKNPSLQLSKQFLQSKEYCSFLKIHITYKLWTLSLVPLLETDKKLRMCLTRKTNSQIYSTVHQIFKTSAIQYLMIFKISNFWSSKNKLWILSNVCIEKKFLIHGLKIEKKSCLKTLIQYFSIVHLCVLIKEQLLAKTPKFRLEFFEYNCFLFFPLTYETKHQQHIQTLLSDLAELHGLSLKFVQLYPVSDGLDFLGWHFKKQWLNPTVLSLANIRSHQNELKKYLKMTAQKGVPVDQIIDTLNKKIQTWKEFCGAQNLPFKLNDYLFWRIWHWIQKRHRNKSSKWLYARYWKKSPTHHQWMFSMNHVFLIPY